MRPVLPLLAFFTALGALLASPDPARAQREGADATTTVPPTLEDSLTGDALRAYQAARMLLNNGDPRGAMTKLQLAYDQSHDPRLLFDMAVCARDLRAYARMRSLLERYEREASTVLGPAERADVEAAIGALRDLVGTLRIDASEPGAEVTIDAVPVATTPLPAPLALDLGAHTVSITKAGFAPFEQSVEILGGEEAHVTARLIAAVQRAHLVIAADSAATVMVDHNDVGRGRYDAMVGAGVHDVEVTAPGKRSYATSFTLVGGETRTVHVSLEPEPARSPAVWPWIAGGVVLVAGAAVGAYFVFRPHEQGGVPSTLGPPIVVNQ